ncbi:MAG: efflux RND transporter periplasmic adaptor subunit [Deferribacteraceae bacterium]|nr:efflux RND transporter periplasmic adaptor subunit [Deferribacteraceae bacterium]
MIRIIQVLLCILLALPTYAQVLVSATAAKSGKIAPSAEYIGDIKYYAVSKVAAERPGRVESLSIEDGKLVKQDDVMLTLNRDILAYTISSQEAKVGQLKSSFDKAKRDFERTGALFRDGATSKQKYDDSETEYLVQSKLYDAGMAELMVMREELKRATLRAPFDGVILTRYVNLYEWVSEGAPLFEIASSRLEAVVNVPQAVVSNIKSGLVVEVIVEGKSYKGTVRAIIPQGNTLTRTFPVRIDLPSSTALLGGMDCRVNVPTSEAIPAILIPRDAVTKRNNQDVVFVIQEDKAVMTPVTIVGHTGTSIGVRANTLKAGAMIVTRGYERLSNGQSVAVSEL